MTNPTYRARPLRVFAGCDSGKFIIKQHVHFNLMFCEIG